ncbi:MAG: tetratricopeptide repeat protein [Bacteroidales bacterium]|nr:tetratricopeptide repeat protein [Bacteroidales bacterium]
MIRLSKFIFFALTSLLLISCGMTGKMTSRAGMEEFYYMEGLHHYHAGNYSTAENTFKQLLSINPNHDAALYYMANIKMGFGKREEALRYMHAAAQADTSNYWYQMQIAQLYSMNQQKARAAEVYEDLLARYPKKIDLYYDLANLYLNLREIDKALLLLDDIEKFGGVSEATGFYRFNILMMQGKREEAQPLIEELAQSYPSPRVLTLLGDLYAESGSDSLALACYDGALLDDPGFIPAIFGQAEVYRLSQQYDLFFEKMSLFMDDDFVDASMKIEYMEQLLQNRAFAANFLRQVDTLFTKLYRCHQTDSAVVYRYAGFLVQANKEEQAVAVLKQHVEEDTGNQMAWHQYLSINYFLQRWDDMYAIANQALLHFPKQPQFMTMAGIAVWQKGQIPEAISIFESILPLAKKDRPLLTQTYAVLGDLYHAAGKQEKSFKAYEKSLQLDPDQHGTLNNYAYFLSLAGIKLQKAYEMSKRTIDAEPQNATYLDTFGWVLYKMGRYQEAKAIFRQVLIYGKDLSAEVLDHYAEVLYALKEYDMAFMYWEQAKFKEKNPELEKKMEERKIQMKK